MIILQGKRLCLLNAEDTIEKLILRSDKIRSTFYTESTLQKLLCKPKDRVATEDKNNVVHEIDCSNCEAVYFDECKWSLKSLAIVKRMKLRNTVGKQIITLGETRRNLLIRKAG